MSNVYKYLFATAELTASDYRQLNQLSTEQEEVSWRAYVSVQRDESAATYRTILENVDTWLDSPDQNAVRWGQLFTLVDIWGQDANTAAASGTSPAHFLSSAPSLSQLPAMANADNLEGSLRFPQTTAQGGPPPAAPPPGSLPPSQNRRF